MKTARNGRRAKEKRKGTGAEQAAATVAALLCVLLLSFMAYDGERYSGADTAVPVSITFTPPSETEPPGFWDIFTDAVSVLFFPGG